MKIAIHQPNYIPWLGYFYKIAHSDTFVLLDDAQYSNGAEHNRNLIKTPNGKVFLTIPVKYKLGDPINKVRTKDELEWKKKHLKTIEMNYKRAPYFEVVYELFSSILTSTYRSIAELNEAIIIEFSRRFGFKTEFIKSSDMQINTHREERVIDICCALKADCYISGNGAKSYQVEDHFTKRGVTLKYNNYKTIEYQQIWRDFIPNLSVLDFVFNHGFDWNYVEKAVSNER